MKKRIALLLAFSMILSTLPMNVFARAWTTQLPFAQNTGSLVERQLGPATNVRHWDDGVLVGEEANVNAVIAGENNSKLARAPGGNMRNLVFSSDYFVGRNVQGNTNVPILATNIIMDISNVNSWLAEFGSYPNKDFRILPLVPNVSNNKVASLDFLGLVAADQETTSPGPIDPPVGGIVIDEMDPPEDTIDHINPDGTLSVGDANEQVRDIVDWLASGIQPVDEKDFIRIHADSLSKDDRANAKEINGNINDISKITTGTTRINTDRPATVANNDVSAWINYKLDPQERVNLLNKIDSLLATGSTALDKEQGNAIKDWLAWYDDVQDQLNKFVKAGTDNAGLIEESKRLTEQAFNNAFNKGGKIMYSEVWADSITTPRYVIGVAVIKVTGSRANVLMFRSAAFNDEYIRSYGSSTRGVPWFQVPIEYRTNGDTNDNPVYLTFQEQTGWPQVGEANRRTDLTARSDSRFTISTDGDRRYFHRYGRAELPRIRIAEAVQGAFDQREWWIEVELVTPGFYFTESSTNVHIGQVDADDRRDTRYSNTSSNVNNGNDIRPIYSLFPGRIGNGNNSTMDTRGLSGNVEDYVNASRTPETGNSRNTVLSIPIALDGAVSNANRQVNDWFQLRGISIGADDRARIGEVKAEVRLYRAGQGGSTDVNGFWSWHVYRYEDWTDNGVGSAPPAPDFNNAQWSQIQDPSTNTSGWNNIQGRLWNVGGPSVSQYPSGNPSSAGNNGQTVIPLTRNDTNSNWYNANGVWLYERGTPSTVSPPTSGTPAVWLRSEFRWNQQSGTAGVWGKVGDSVYDTQIHVANYGEVGLKLYLHDDDDLEDFDLRSGMREWDFVQTPPVGESRPIGTIIPASSRMEYHTTARVVLEETSPGSLPATGAHPTTYNFGEGVQVLGVRFWTNDGGFSNGHNDTNGYVYYGDQLSEADHFFETSLDRSSVTIRPEISASNRWRLAKVTAEFYLSIEAGYEAKYNTDDIEVTVNSGTIDEPFEDTLVIAHVWDPITVDTRNIVIDENDVQAALGMVRGASVSDITLTVTRASELMPGQRIWVGLEGGISRGWGSADHMALRANAVRTTGTIELTPIQQDSHGFFVEVLKTSKEDGEQIIFSDVFVSGRVVPSHQYNVIVADTAAAHNWEGWGWITNQAADVGFTRGLVRGFFNDEPYVTPAFRYDGADSQAPSPGQPTDPSNPPITTQPGVPGAGKQFTTRTIFESDTEYRSASGELFAGSPLVIRTNTVNNKFATAYVMPGVIADIAAINVSYDQATETATFSDGVTTVTIRNGESTATVNGQIRQITASGLPTQAFIEPFVDRFYVPVAFFRDCVPEFGINVEWHDNVPQYRSIVIRPA